MSSKGKHRKSKKKRASAPPTTTAPAARLDAAPLEAEPLEAAPPAAAPVSSPPPPAAEPLPPEDDLSVPPVGDLATRFFDSSPHIHHDDGGDLHDMTSRDPRVRAMAPAAVQRRAQLARYVKGTVAFASVLCVAALVKAAVTHDQAIPAPRPLPVAASDLTLPAVESSAAVAAVALPPVAVEVPAPVRPAAVEAQAASAESAPPVASATAATIAGNAAPARSATAAEEMKAAQAALEHGNVPGAIRAGERSVALDPGDGRAWLLLGAAYQEAGDAKDARRAFKACVDQARRGPKDECAAMLR